MLEYCVRKNSAIACIISDIFVGNDVRAHVQDEP